MSDLRPLEPLTRRAGVVLVDRDGTPVASHYGSPAGELAVCVRRVGIADRSDLGKLVVGGDRATVAELVDGHAASGNWWCLEAPSRFVVLCEPQRRTRLRELLSAQARHLPGVEIVDATAAWCAIALVGRHALGVLRALGALDGGDPRQTPPQPARIGGAAVHVLMQSDRRALLLVDQLQAAAVWHATEAAGRPFGLSCVGSQAVARYTLLDRAGVPAPLTAAH